MITQQDDGSLLFSLDDNAPLSEQIREACLDNLRLSWLIFQPKGKKAKSYEEKAQRYKKMKRRRLLSDYRHMVAQYNLEED